MGTRRTLTAVQPHDESPALASVRESRPLPAGVELSHAAPSLQIRRATVKDVPQVVELARHFVEQTIYSELFGAFNVALMTTLVRHALKLGVVLVADLDGQLVGMLAVVALDHPMSGDRYADELAWWVEPAYRGSTIGPRLLHACEDWSHAQRLVFMKMVAPLGGDDVAAFYERHGYRAVETAYIKRVAS